MESLKLLIRRVIFTVAGVVITLIVISFFLTLFGANPLHPVVSFFQGLGGLFINPFRGVASLLFLGATRIDLAAVVAIVVWVLGSVIIAELLTSFINDDPVLIFVDIIDALLKFLEFLLASRIILALVGMGPVSSGFAAFVYQSTAWSQGILPNLNFLTGVIDFSALLILAIIAVVDLGLEDTVQNFRETRIKQRSERVVTRSETKVEVRPAAPAMVAPVMIAPQAAPNKPQNITINVAPPIGGAPLRPATPQAPRPPVTVNVQPAPIMAQKPKKYQ